MIICLFIYLFKQANWIKGACLLISQFFHSTEPGRSRKGSFLILLEVEILSLLGKIGNFEQLLFFSDLGDSF